MELYQYDVQALASLVGLPQPRVERFVSHNRRFPFQGEKYYNVWATKNADREQVIVALGKQIYLSYFDLSGAHVRNETHDSPSGASAIGRMDR